MPRILSAIFDNRRDAEGAISELVLSGFARSTIRLGTGDPAEARPDPAAPGDGGANFFHTLFGTDDSPFVSGIDGAVTRSHQVLTVVAPDLDEVERAAAIVERYGPLDIDATSASGDDPGPVSAAAWQAWARTRTPARSAETPRYDSSANQQGGALTQQQAEPPGQPHQAGASQQFAVGENKVDLHAMHQAAVEGFYKAQHEHPAEQTAAEDDASRAARQAQLAGERFPGDEHYDEYAPAYLYGLDMATHEQHGGKEWDEAEPDLRGEWEQRHPQSAWAKFKDAVRHGWDRLRSERLSH